MANKIEQIPKLFKCEECKVFFFSYSQMKKPTHSKCKGHQTRKATNEEIDQINKFNKTHFQYLQNECLTKEEKMENIEE